MAVSVTLDGWKWPRIASLIAGVGMTGTALLTVRHYYAVNFPASIYTGAACDLNAFLNCDSAAFGPLAQVGGIPVGFFGAMVGALVVLGTLFPSERLERTNIFLAACNALAAAGLAIYAVGFDGSLCPYGGAYGLCALASFGVFWRWGSGHAEDRGVRRLLRPSLLVLAAFGGAVGAGAYAYGRFTAAKLEARSGGEAARVVREFFALPRVPWPSTVSPFWSVRSTARFEDAPIQVVAYTDFLCSDCLMAFRQMQQLRRDFAGRLNVAFQPFPLETACNDVVDKNKHPGACAIAAIALAAGPQRFARIHDEIFGHFREAKTPAWRADLARRYGVEGATADSAIRSLEHRLIATGKEYAKTSDRYPFGIRSTPTMIVNNRMIIGTLPTAQLRAIFQALVDRRAETGSRSFIENWVP